MDNRQYASTLGCICILHILHGRGLRLLYWSGSPEPRSNNKSQFPRSPYYIQTGFLGTRPPKLNTMELTPFASMPGTIVFGAICSCLFLTSCSSDEDPVKSYSNYRITVDAASPVSFTALGETRTITVSASKEICWDGKPSGETEPAKVTASVEGEHFISESSQTEVGLLLKVTTGENETEEMQKGKIVLTVQDDTATETRTVELNQNAATIEYGSYKIAFAEEKTSLPYMGGKGNVSFTCQREKMINGKSKGFENCSLNGIRYKATQKNDATYSIEKSAETGVYMLKYVVPEAVTIHEVSNTFYFLDIEGEKIASFDIILGANSNGDDSYFVSTEISGIYKE